MPHTTGFRCMKRVIVTIIPEDINGYLTYMFLGTNIIVKHPERYEPITREQFNKMSSQEYYDLDND